MPLLLRTRRFLCLHGSGSAGFIVVVKLWIMHAAANIMIISMLSPVCCMICLCTDIK